MSDFSKATPRPWVVKVRHYEDAPDRFMVKSGDDLVAYHAKEANAAIIVEAVNSYEPMKARIAELEAAARNILPYLKFTIGPESPGHHPTMPSAVSAFEAAFGKDRAG